MFDRLKKFSGAIIATLALCLSVAVAPATADTVVADLTILEAQLMTDSAPVVSIMQVSADGTQSCTVGDIPALQPGATIVITDRDIAAACPGIQRFSITVRSPHIVATHAKTIHRGREKNSLIFVNTAPPDRYH